MNSNNSIAMLLFCITNLGHAAEYKEREAFIPSWTGSATTTTTSSSSSFSSSLQSPRRMSGEIELAGVSPSPVTTQVFNAMSEGYVKEQVEDFLERRTDAERETVERLLQNVCGSKCTGTGYTGQACAVRCRHLASLVEKTTQHLDDEAAYVSRASNCRLSCLFVGAFAVWTTAAGFVGAAIALHGKTCS